MKITIDTERIIEFADPEETLVEFARRVQHEAKCGIGVVWTQNAANVGEVTR